MLLAVHKTKDSYSPVKDVTRDAPRDCKIARLLPAGVRPQTATCSACAAQGSTEQTVRSTANPIGLSAIGMLESVGRPKATKEAHGRGIQIARMVNPPQSHDGVGLGRRRNHHFVALPKAWPVASVRD